MLIAAAVCPHPPLLIPAAIGAAAGDRPPELSAVGDACQVAVHALATAEPNLIAVVGGGPADLETVLAMGDASARRARGTGDPDPQAQAYDGEVAGAFAAADDRWLGRLDPELDDELMVAGRAAWQVLAGAADGTRLQGRLLCQANPYGVSYLVASWAEP
jgi:hypothetical protein